MMFGHDNNDNGDNAHHDDQGQITLPPTNAFDDASSGDNGESLEDRIQPAADAAPAEPTPIVHRPTPKDSGAPADELLDIKQQALQALTPLVDHLEQTPEEKFRTTMMMIQASDNHSLIKAAYEAAQKISDDKERAQAFLDIVNEINYFTQQNQQAA